MIHHINERKPVCRKKDAAANVEKNQISFALSGNRFEIIQVFLKCFPFEKNRNYSHNNRTTENPIKKNIRRGKRVKRFQNQTEGSPKRESNNCSEIIF